MSNRKRIEQTILRYEEEQAAKSLQAKVVDLAD